MFDFSAESGLKHSVYVACISRIALVLIGFLALNFIGVNTYNPSKNLSYHQKTADYLEMWTRWDAEWYLLIADHGYDSGKYLSESIYKSDSAPAVPTAGFYPLYPALIAILSFITGSGIVSGYLISNISFIVFVILFYKLLRLDFDENLSFRVVLYYCVFPAAIFFSSLYSESLFLMLSTAAVYSHRKKRFLNSSVFAFLAALTRPVGIFLFFYYIADLYFNREESGYKILNTLSPPAGVLTFFTYCHFKMGNFLAPVKRQVWWRGETGGPWKGFVEFFKEGPALVGYKNSGVDFVVALIFLAALVFMYNRMKKAYFWFALPAAVFPLCSSLMSYTRLSLAAFPVFIVFGIWGKKKIVHYSLIIFFTLWQSAYMILFATWNWAG